MGAVRRRDQPDHALQPQVPGCYSGLYSKHGELSEAEMDRLFTECRSMGDYFVVLTGGEPYLLKDGLLRLFRKHNDMYFLTFTNGTLLDEPLVDELARLGNVAPALSLEGFGRRPTAGAAPGCTRSVLESMDLLAHQGVLVRHQRHLRQRQRGRGHRRPVHRVHARSRRPVRLVLHVHARGQGPGAGAGSRRPSSASAAAGAWPRCGRSTACSWPISGTTGRRWAAAWPAPGATCTC